MSLRTELGPLGVAATAAGGSHVTGNPNTHRKVATTWHPCDKELVPTPHLVPGDFTLCVLHMLVLSALRCCSLPTLCQLTVVLTLTSA